MLLPAPVELACPDGARGALCDRDAAVADLVRKRGAAAALVPAGLQAVCGGNPFAPEPTSVATCERTFEVPTTIHGVAGHMHLLGRSIRIELNAGADDARVLLDIPRFVWGEGTTDEMCLGVLQVTRR
jgi:hypothetical protein